MSYDQIEKGRQRSETSLDEFVDLEGHNTEGLSYPSTNVVIGGRSVICCKCGNILVTSWKGTPRPFLRL